MSLLPGWSERLQRASDPPPERATLVLPKSADYYLAGDLRVLSTAAQVQDLVEFTLQRPLSHIGIDTEFRYDRPGVAIDRRSTANDPRSIRPMLLALALVELEGAQADRLYRFVVDLRRPEVCGELGPLFRLPIPFAGHHLKVELFCLWQCGIEEPAQIWDTYIHEKARSLGAYHAKYRLPRAVNELDQARAEEESRELKEYRCDLISTCRRYEVWHAFASDKARLQRSFLTHGEGDAFSDEQLHYAAEDAVAAACLYPRQVLEATRQGLLSHVVSIEMPWVVTNARMEWNGVCMDLPRGHAAQQRVADVESVLRERLARLGVANPNSHPQLQAFFQSYGVLEAFRKGSGYSFDGKQLKRLEQLHPAIRLVRRLRQAQEFRTEKLFWPELVGADGRVHAELRQLGADTGRQSSRWPNLLGLHRALRPFVVAEPGYGIGEVDWSQVEVGVAAVVYRDRRLTEMFNTGDVYSAMAQLFFHDKLSEEERGLPGKAFKRSFPGLRNQIKTCTLGIIYGVTAHGLAQQLNASPAEAAKLQARFMAMFPVLQTALTVAAAFGTLRGYAATLTGLRRSRAPSAKPSRWERNWMTNHPVQGSAAAVFKAAGNRLDRLYRRHGARLLAPMYDAFVFEAPLPALEEVTALTERVMCDTLQEFCSELQPRVEVNLSRPECWNKDGEVDALEHWIAGCHEDLEPGSAQRQVLGEAR